MSVAPPVRTGDGIVDDVNVLNNLIEQEIKQHHDAVAAELKRHQDAMASLKERLSNAQKVAAAPKVAKVAAKGPGKAVAKVGPGKVVPVVAKEGPKDADEKVGASPKVVAKIGPKKVVAGGGANKQWRMSLQVGRGGVPQRPQNGGEEVEAKKPADPQVALKVPLKGPVKGLVLKKDVGAKVVALKKDGSATKMVVPVKVKGVLKKTPSVKMQTEVPRPSAPAPAAADDVAVVVPPPAAAVEKAVEPSPPQQQQQQQQAVAKAPAKINKKVVAFDPTALLPGSKPPARVEAPAAEAKMGDDGVLQILNEPKKLNDEGTVGAKAKASLRPARNTPQVRPKSVFIPNASSLWDEEDGSDWLSSTQTNKERELQMKKQASEDILEASNTTKKDAGISKVTVDFNNLFGDEPKPRPPPPSSPPKPAPTEAGDFTESLSIPKSTVDFFTF